MSLLGEKSEQLLDEVGLRSPDGIAIYLVGMMASGKSFVGRVVANALYYTFYESDNVIQSCLLGWPCWEIYYLLGETYFRNLETEARQSLSGEKCLVVATGGGAVCEVGNWYVIAVCGSWKKDGHIMPRLIADSQ